MAQFYLNHAMPAQNPRLIQQASRRRRRPTSKAGLSRAARPFPEVRSRRSTAAGSSSEKVIVIFFFTTRLASLAGPAGSRHAYGRTLRFSNQSVFREPFGGPLRGPGAQGTTVAAADPSIDRKSRS